MRNENGHRPRIGGGSAGRDGSRERVNYNGDEQRRPRFNRDGQFSGNRGGENRRFGRPAQQDERGEHPQFDGERRPRRFGEGGAREEHRSFGENRRPNYGEGRRNFDGNRHENFEGRRNDENRHGNFEGNRRPSNFSNGEQRRPRFNGVDGNRDYSFRPARHRDANFDENAKYSQKKQMAYKKHYIDYDAPMRLNKFLANSGICSRREADEYIEAGVVTVNGEVVTEMGVKVIPSKDKVLFHDQLVRCERRVYILLNKPKDCVTTSDDPQARMTVLDLVKNACKERVYPVGRLDRNTTGVLLITNDGDLTSKMTHPKYNQKKIYEAVLDHEMTEEDAQRLRNGVDLEDGEIHVDDISINAEDHRKVGVEIHSGRNRIVRRMFDAIGYKVLRLDRVYFAGLTKKNLPRGKWRFLTEQEINILKMSN